MSVFSRSDSSNPGDLDRITNAITGHEVLDLTAINRSLATFGESI